MPPTGTDGASEVYTWGQGTLGQLGHSDEKSQRVPRLIVAFLSTNVVQVSCGNQHSAVLLESGEVYTFGRGNFGQLGQGATASTNVSTPAVVATLQGKVATQIACGWHHTAALLDNGNIFTWGSGEYGRLGHGDEARQVVPKLVEALAGKGIKSISCGGFHTAAISDRGQLYTWGGGYFGQLGHGDEADKKQPRVVKALRDKTITQVACGTHHTLGLSDTSDVFAWGSGEYGKLGVGDEEKYTLPTLVEGLRGKGVTQVACGGFHSAVLTDSNLVLTFGGGDKGQLGHGDEHNQSVPVVLEALRGHGVVKLACGMHHTCALSDKGDVFTWGSGEYGRLGHDDEVGHNAPQMVEVLHNKGITDIAAGAFHMTALKIGEADPLAKPGQGMPSYVPSKDREAAVEQDDADETLGDARQKKKEVADNQDDEDVFLTAKAREQRFNVNQGDDDEEDYKLKEALKESHMEVSELRKQLQMLQERHKLEQTRLETRLQGSQEERNHMRKQLERLQEKQAQDANLKAKLQTLQEEGTELRKKFERSRGDLKQRTVDVHMLQVRVAQLCGSELDGLTVSQLEELERMQSEAIRRVGVAKYSRLRQEFQEKEDHLKEEVAKMKKDFESRMDSVRQEVSKIQEEKVHLMGLEQRLRQEFQTQVQAEQMSNEELRIRLETLQDGFVQLRSILRKEKQSRLEDRHPGES